MDEPRATHSAQRDPRVRPTAGIGVPPLTVAQKHGIDQVLAAGWHLLALVNEILDLAQIEAGKDVASCESSGQPGPGRSTFARHPDLRLLTAVDSHAGIELARTSVPDVSLMDINLPGMNGMQAMRTLRADPATGHILVIAVSAVAMPIEIESALEAGFFSYLTKPIKLNELMSALGVTIKFSQTKLAPSDPNAK